MKKKEKRVYSLYVYMQKRFLENCDSCDKITYHKAVSTINYSKSKIPKVFFACIIKEMEEMGLIQQEEFNSFRIINKEKADKIIKNPLNRNYKEVKI